jgi:hypothetical protein
MFATTSAYGERAVAVAPFTTLGSEDPSSETRKLVGQLEAAIARLPAARLVSAAQVSDAIKRAKKPVLRSCERELPCLAELGRLVSAQIVVSGEVGGLGDARVVYLTATDTVSEKELRSTTMRLGTSETAESAVVRLLDPDRYRGLLKLAIDVPGAVVFVNGTKVTMPAAGLALPVGTQAVRVTHPEYRDFVRFVDVEYGRTAEVGVALSQYPIVRRDLTGVSAAPRGTIVQGPSRWRRWYVVLPAAAAVALATGIVVALIVNDLPRGVPCRNVDGSSC